MGANASMAVFKVLVAVWQALTPIIRGILRLLEAATAVDARAVRTSCGSAATNFTRLVQVVLTCWTMIPMLRHGRFTMSPAFQGVSRRRSGVALPFEDVE